MPYGNPLILNKKNIQNERPNILIDREVFEFKSYQTIAIDTSSVLCKLQKPSNCPLKFLFLIHLFPHLYKFLVQILSTKQKISDNAVLNKLFFHLKNIKWQHFFFSFLFSFFFFFFFFFALHFFSAAMQMIKLLYISLISLLLRACNLFSIQNK